MKLMGIWISLVPLVTGNFVTFELKRSTCWSHLVPNNGEARADNKPGLRRADHRIVRSEDSHQSRFAPTETCTNRAKQVVRSGPGWQRVRINLMLGGPRRKRNAGPFPTFFVEYVDNTRYSHPPIIAGIISRISKEVPLASSRQILEAFTTATNAFPIYKPRITRCRDLNR